MATKDYMLAGDSGWCNATEFAALIGISSRRVSQLAEDGVLVRNAGLYNIKESMRRYFKNLDDVGRARNVKTDTGSEVDPVGASARLSREKCLLQDLKNSATVADLVPANVIEKAVGAMVSIAAGRLSILADQLERIVIDAGHTKREAAVLTRDVAAAVEMLKTDAPKTMAAIRGEAIKEEAAE